MLYRQQLRQTIRQQRQILTQVQRLREANTLHHKVINHSKFVHAKHVGLFLSTKEEIDTQPIIETCWQLQKSVYVPIIDPHRSGIMQFIQYQPQTRLQTNRFNMQEPVWQQTDFIDLSTLDFLLVPLVAFDHLGNRLGMGGGYYDRLLSHYQQLAIYPIGIAYDCQYVDVIPTENWDIPLPEIITASYHIMGCQK